MIEPSVNFKRNRILGALETEEFERLSQQLEYVELRLGTVLYDADEPIRHAYFPLSGTVSIVTVLEDGMAVEAGVIGNEGMAGISLVLGYTTEVNRRAMIQIPGSGLRIKAEALTEESNRSRSLRDLLLRYLHAFITQISQTAACNRIHRVDERLARWLLSMQDRMASDELHLTQELIAEMLGVRRAGVSVAATRLQEKGLITYKRGHIQILDRQRLEAASCECYETVKREYDRLFENADFGMRNAD